HVYPLSLHDALPISGPADVAQQLLEDRRGANDLNADRVLRPGHCVREAGRSIPTRVAKDGFGQLQKTLLTDTADAFDHLRRVARIVSLQNLQHAPRILQRRILWRVAGILPAGGVVLPPLRVQAREDAIQILRILKRVTDESG